LCWFCLKANANASASRQANLKRLSPFGFIQFLNLSLRKIAVHFSRRCKTEVEVSLRRNDELRDEWSASKIYPGESEIQL
jgi:hypothetical protein